ncbi:ADP-ribosylglycohydrolase family protein [Oenococcus alcoholitolerans]|uniref:ADP-ribosylglycohydrolase n=1 Tax=Oenococcus alcoholitolerans TaxID=931074 RepID=A0ABR4XS63_9LACO|nr:ADP-ribosylglycohydrolase [Oenococcus alcoholitolerans]
MTKRLTPVGRLIYGLAIGDTLGNLSKRNANLAIKPDFDFKDADFTFAWTPTTGLTLAVFNAVSLGFSKANVMHNFAEWWRNGQYSMNDSIQSERFETEIQSIINFELTRDLDSIGTTDPTRNDENVLIRALPVAFYEIARFGSGYVNNERAMDAIHDLVSLTHNYTSAMMGAGTISFLISQIIAKESLHQALENSIAITYEYYFRRAIFQQDLVNFSRLNMPNISALDPKDLIHDGSVIHTLENVYWVLSSTDSVTDAVKLAIKIFSKQRQTVISLIYAIYALIDRNNIDERLIQQIDKKSVTNLVLILANRSNKFHLRQ